MTGLVGIGEATLETHEEAVLAYLEAAKRRHVIGTDPYRIEDLWLRMFRDDYCCYTRYGFKDLLAVGAVDIIQPDSARRRDPRNEDRGHG